MRFIVMTFFVLASVFVAPFVVQSQNAFAQNMTQNASSTGPDFSTLKQDGIARVIKVIDPQTILLQDGRTVRLSSLYFPDLGVQDAGEYAVLAKKVLEDFLLDQSVILYQTPDKNKGRVNRMGHHIAHIQRQSDKIWVQGLLLSLGLAQAQTSQSTPQMAQAMYEIENKARQDKIGLWQDARFGGVRTIDDVGQYMDSFQIVQGTVRSTALKNNVVYLNFDTDWRKDFTVSISSSDKRLFVKQGIDPLRWNNKTLRVRGWVREYNGPYMEIDHPEAIELIEDESATHFVSPPAVAPQN